MKNEKKINLHIFGFIYFILFIIPVALNDHEPFLKFPKMDEKFQHKMIIDVGLGIGLGFLIVLFSLLLVRFTKIFNDLIETLDGLLGPLTTLEIFFIAAFSSVAEEFFFRGLIQGKLGIVVATVFFGILHSGPGKKYIPWTVFAFVVGALLGGVYEWRQNLITPIVIHFVANFINLLLMQKIRIISKNT
jgi:membrane protease YdiL (CAAX protease family)